MMTMGLLWIFLSLTTFNSLEMLHFILNSAALKLPLYEPTGLYKGPYFEAMQDNYTAIAGTHAFLACKVKQLGLKSVSWIRSRDSSLLTVGLFTYTNEKRFQIIHNEEAGSWTLQIKYAALTDSGTYECQISSDPKLSHFIQLQVIEPKVQFMGDSEMYVKRNSSVILKCYLGQHPAYAFWYRNGNRILERNSNSKEIISQYQQPNSSDFITELAIANVDSSDAGNYTCGITEAMADSTLVHVVEEENQAAIQSATDSLRIPFHCFLNLLVFHFAVSRRKCVSS